MTRFPSRWALLAPAVLFASLAATLAVSAPALAAGFMLRENSAETLATSSAGNGSRATGPDTVFANPAGMTMLTSDGFEAGVVGVLPSMTFSGSATQATPMGAVPLAGNNGGDSGRAALIPNMYGVMRLTDTLSAGLAITAPFGNSNEYDSNWYGRYLGTKTAAVSADINPAIAWQIDDAWSVGAGFSAQYLKLDVTSSINQAAIFGAPVPDASYRFKASDWAFGYNLGMLVDLGGTRVGLTYRSSTHHKIEGSLDFTGASPLLGMVNGAANAKTQMPATTGLSITSEITPDLSVSADLQFTQWSVFKNVVIESQNPPFPNVQGYRDSWMVALGGVYKIDEQWSIKSGIAFDETPVTSRYRAVSMADTDRYLLGVGAEVKLTEHMTVEAAYGHSFSFNNPNMNSSVNNTDSITHSTTLNGRYDINVDIVAVTFRYAI